MHVLAHLLPCKGAFFNAIDQDTSLGQASRPPLSCAITMEEYLVQICGIQVSDFTIAGMETCVINVIGDVCWFAFLVAGQLSGSQQLWL